MLNCEDWHHPLGHSIYPTSTTIIERSVPIATVDLEPRRRSGCGSAYITLSDPLRESVLPAFVLLHF